MGLHSLVLVAVLIGLAAGNPQGPKSAVPAVTAPAQVCGGCFGVADVLGVVFGDEIITQLHTQVISIGLGNNGTNVTRTTILTGQSQFTFNSGGVVGSASPGGQTNFYSGSGGTITLAGVELTSPTAYNVFTAYSITSTLNSDGQCITVQGTPVQVSPASSYAIPSGADYALFAQEAEQSFINDIGFPTCSPGGENAAVPTTHVQVTESTVTSTTSGPIRPTPQPVSVSTVAPTTTSASPISIISILASSSVVPVPFTNGTTTFTSQITVGTIIIVGGSTFVPVANATIIPYGGPASKASHWRLDLDTSWLLWSAGILSVAVSLGML